ncbi:protein trichome birefringence-like 20 [Impatiens glandulifera]|uniref:protein trichome birefringence-like 20 n=1 Tax=Impatiens glandulifera TaxID=253017 RepID=UPI001FB16367|nr:protein trichome birefringence-like 20 [Impatiens glandulifera]
MNKQQSLLTFRKMKGSSSRKIVPLMALSWLFIIAIIIPVYYYLFHNINYSSKPEAEAAAYHSNSQISINSLLFNPHHHHHHGNSSSSIINKTTTPASSSASSIQLDNIINNNNNNGDQEESIGHNITAAASKNGQAMTKEKESCDLSMGEWVPNPEGPYYTNTTCSAIQEHQNCMRFGRPDTDFQKWRWKPEGCELPIFDPLEFLEMMRGKKLAFVGDSVARNHMQSLICLLSRVGGSGGHYSLYFYYN